MNRVLIASATLALTLSSYAQAQVPEGVLGEAATKPASSAAKPADPAMARKAAGLRLPARRLAGALDKAGSGGQSSLRGAGETRVYKTASPSVVLVVSKAGVGSGALISADGKIVTNLHVVGDDEEVGVIFKPAQEGAKIGKDVHMAKVLRRDGQADLALIQVGEMPAGVTPLKIAEPASVEVGADVHAIGHPTGETWTYTRGIVSQIRQDYAWSTEDKIPHKATVIQTQTPINPGNSGGPLLNDAVEIVGVNSFSGDGEGMNYAVSSADVRTLLTLAADRGTAKPEACEVKEIAAEPSKKPKGQTYYLDTDCDGVEDVIATIPNSKKEPVSYVSDDDGDGKLDTVIYDFDHDGELDVALYDTDADGKPDLKGYYRQGEDEPYRVEKISN